MVVVLLQPGEGGLPDDAPPRLHGAGEAHQAGDRQQQRAAPHAEHQRRLPESAHAAAAPRGRETQQGQSLGYPE